MPLGLDASALAFLTERHLASLTTLRADATPHVVPVGFTYDAATRVARVITRRGSVKARNVGAGGRAVLCQVDGRRWPSLEGEATLRTDAEAVAEAVRRYAQRYRSPRPNPERVAIEITVDRILGGA
jgi:PPOX class probable F420-dependent enzyme